MRMILKIIFMTTLCFSTVFSRSGDGREIIKAYERGKPAKMDIEITKVKSDNYIEMVIDRSNKKIYKDITEYAPENRDMQKKLYVTDYIKKMDKSMRETLPYRVVSHGEKRYLEIDYSGIAEPREIYLWVVEGKKVEKLYTGIMEREYFDPNNPLSYIDMDKTGVIEGDNEKIVEEKGHRVKIKVGEIRLAELSKRGLTDTDIYLALKDDYRVFSENMKELKDINLFFSNNEKNIVLNKTNNTVEIMGEIDKRDIVDKKIYVSTKGSNVNEFQVEARKPSKARSLEKHHITFRDYIVDLATKEDDKIVYWINITKFFKFSSSKERVDFIFTNNSGNVHFELFEHNNESGKEPGIFQSGSRPKVENLKSYNLNPFDSGGTIPDKGGSMKITEQEPKRLVVTFEGDLTYYKECKGFRLSHGNNGNSGILVTFGTLTSVGFELDVPDFHFGEFIVGKAENRPAPESGNIKVTIEGMGDYSIEVSNVGSGDSGKVTLEPQKKDGNYQSFIKTIKDGDDKSIDVDFNIKEPLGGNQWDEAYRTDEYLLTGTLNFKGTEVPGVYGGNFFITTTVRD